MRWSSVARERARVDAHAALRAAEGQVHDRALPGHPHRERRDLAEVDVVVVADAALRRAHGEQVLHAIAEDRLDGRVVVAAERERDDVRALRRAQPLPDVLVEPHLLRRCGRAAPTARRYIGRVPLEAAGGGVLRARRQRRIGHRLPLAVVGAGEPTTGCGYAARAGGDGMAGAGAAASAATDDATRARRILSALVLGAASGALARLVLGDSPLLTRTIDWVAYPLGQVFLRLLFLAVLPLVTSSLALGVCELGDVRRLGRHLRRLPWAEGQPQFGDTPPTPGYRMLRAFRPAHSPT